MLSCLVLVIGVLLLVALVLKIACPLPERAPLPADQPVPEVASPLEFAASEFAQDDEETNLLFLRAGLEAFAMRLAMVRAANRTIDAQYYIWEGDLSGRMLLSEILAAADRGVRVRLLVDDNATAGLDPMWAGANAHPNITVRLFNPLVIRRVRSANYLFDFPRLNRRMHNKSLTVDAAATLVGGRNIGDEYFAAKEEGLFIDVDALAIGPVVAKVVDEFQHYWDSAPSYPAETMLSKVSPIPLERLRKPDYADPERADAYRLASEQALDTLNLEDTQDAFIQAPVRLVADDPQKAFGKQHSSSLLITHLMPLLESARSNIDVVSAYFVPGRKGRALFRRLPREGVQTRIVTNSWQVTDVPLVHAGYAPHRRELLEAGASLFEARPHEKGGPSGSKLGRTRFSGGGEAVHAKVFQVDEEVFFVGSFNLDPRSALLNCEMGFIVQSAELARALRVTLDERLPAHTYQVMLDPKGRMGWATGGENSRFTHREPGSTLLSRALIAFFAILPIRWLL